jgi:hypothetical protein
MVFPLLKRWSCAIIGIASSHHKFSMSGSFPLEDHDSNQKSTGSSSKAKSAFAKRYGGFRHPLSIPNDTAWGSDEAIVTVEGEGKGAQAKIDGEVLQKVDEERETLSGIRTGPGGIVKTREWQVVGE